MPRRRRGSGSLLLPDHIAEPPKRVADADAEYAAAIQAGNAAAAKVREAREAHRAAKHEDRPPKELRKLDDAIADAEHAFREASRVKDRTEEALAQAIKAEESALAEQVDVRARTERIQALIDELVGEFDRQADEAGTVRTIAHITDTRTRTRGFEPLRLVRDRHSNPAAHLAALRAYALEVLAQVGGRQAEANGDVHVAETSEKVAA